MNELFRRLLFLPPQRSSMAASIDALHYFVIGVTFLGATVVTLAGAWFIIRYRRPAVPQSTSGNPDSRVTPPWQVEVGVVIGLFALFITWWAIGAKQYVRLRVAPEGSMTIYVTAKQWMWKFAYPSGDASVATVTVPSGRPVQLVMTSRDVIHSFYVPHFRVKQDVVPGRYTTVWFEATEPGRYPIYCTEYCGVGHSTMRGEVIVLSPKEYEEWAGGDAPLAVVERSVDALPFVPYAASPREEVNLARVGRVVAAEQGCLRCHTLDGTPHIGPTWAGLYGSVSPLERGGEVVVDGAYITESMMDPLARVVRGFSPVMPSYLGRIQPAETAAILELMRELRDERPIGDRTLPDFVPADGTDGERAP